MDNENIRAYDDLTADEELELSNHDAYFDGILIKLTNGAIEEIIEQERNI